jgi:DNA phosphorothioation-dependent restriction protein DptG
VGAEQLLAKCLVNNLAWYFLRLEELDEADRCARRGVVLFEKLEDLKGVAQGKRHLGKSALVKGLDDYYEPDESWPTY